MRREERTLEREAAAGSMNIFSLGVGAEGQWQRKVTDEMTMGENKREVGHPLPLFLSYFLLWSMESEQPRKGFDSRVC